MGVCHPVGYRARTTPDSDLVRIVRDHLPAFIERIEQAGDALPGFVLDELRGLLDCGDFERGFVRLCCTRCGDELRVPFACKARSVCPSCVGRRMCETAANWLEGLLPEVPYRQWVLSFDSSFAVRLGYDATALDLVCRSLARHIAGAIRRNVKKRHDLPSVASLHPGLITVVQRFRSDCGLFVHVHLLVTDGAFEQSDTGVVFHPALRLDAPAPAPCQLPLFDFAGKPVPPTDSDAGAAAHRMPARSWSWLLARVFAIDIETCARRDCGGRLKIVEVVRDPDSIALHLRGARAPPPLPPAGQLPLPVPP